MRAQYGRFFPGRPWQGRAWRRSIQGLILVLLCCISTLALSQSRLALQVGEAKVLAAPGVARIAVGDGQILNAVTHESDEVIVFARHEGSTTLQIWTDDGRKLRYEVDVAPEGARQTQEQLRRMLERIPNARISSVGDKLLVEGDGLTDADRERLAELAKRYPQLLDFTSQIGWDDMVLLDVKVVEVPRTRLQELGIRWNSESEGGFTAGLAWDGGTRLWEQRPGTADGTLSPMPIGAPVPMAAGYFGINALLSSRIQAMAQTGSAVVLAQPQLLARSGATAEFLAGGEVPYSTVDAQGNTNTAFKPYGVSLRITPRIERGAVRSRIEVEVSAIDSALSVPNGPSLKTRRASTEFNVRSGQTLVLAGFISREDARNVNKLPALGDMPLLGGLFRSTRRQHNETELAIFVTPVVLAPDHPDLQRRVWNSQRVLHTAFPEGELLNTPVTALEGLPPVVQVAGQTGWDPYQGAGSQWQGDAPITPFATPAATPRRRGANQHVYED